MKVDRDDILVDHLVDRVESMTAQFVLDTGFERFNLIECHPVSVA